jgi:hypothetical protein
MSRAVAGLRHGVPVVTLDRDVTACSSVRVIDA